MKSSLFPPGAPVPEPPGTKLIARIPIFFVGSILLFYLFYNIYLEAVDRNLLPGPRTMTVSEEEHFSPFSKPLTHPIANDPLLCLECHKLAFSDETSEIFPGPFLGDRSCLKCHPLKDFDRQHRGHRFEPYENCTMCHSPHKSVEKPLMKESYLKTCTRCHPLRSLEITNDQ